MSPILLFVLYVLAVLGQFLDARTTEVALQNGFKEANPIGRFLIGKLGISGTYAIKCAAFPAIFLFLAVSRYSLAGVLGFVFLAVLGFLLGILDWRKLSAAKITGVL